MKTQFSNRALAFLVLSTLGAVSLGVACSSNGNPSPTGGGGSAGTIVTAASSSSGGPATTSSSSGGTTSSSSTGSGGPTCYDGGTPMTNNDFINPCGACAFGTFPNSTLPGLSADGGLPPLM